MPPVAERHGKADLTPGNSRPLPLASPPVAWYSCPPSSITGSPNHPLAQNPELVSLPQKREAESEGRQDPVKRRREVNFPVINLYVLKKLREMNKTAEKDNDKQKLTDMPFIQKALIELGE